MSLRLPRVRRAIVLVLPLIFSACGASAAHRAATTTLPMPADAPARRQYLDAFARALFAAMRSGDPLSVLADDAEIHALLTPEPATRYAALRHATALGADIATPERLRLALAHAQFAGACLQGSHEGGPMTADGLRARGWVLERLLVAGDDDRAGRMAAWVEGFFVLSDRGIVAIAIDRVEAPRQDHADLELGGCDMAIGLDDHNM